MRLDKFVAYAGFCTRSEARKLIQSGSVFVEGRKITDAGYNLSEQEKQQIQVGGKPLHGETTLYYILNKPDGYLTALEDKRLPTIADLLPVELIYKGLSPVGRLDYHTTGLLILTNDGTLSHRLTSPKWHIPKVYEIVHEGLPITDKEIQLFAEGLTLTDKDEHPQTLKPAELTYQTDTTAVLILTEGKTHQVRRMFAAIQRPVLELRRIRIGPIRLASLPEGSFRPFDKEELRCLQEAAGLSIES